VRTKTKDGPDFAVGYLLQQLVADDPAGPSDVGHSVSRSVAGTQGGNQVGVHLAMGHQLHQDDNLAHRHAHRLDYGARVEPVGNLVSRRTAKRLGVASVRLGTLVVLLVALQGRACVARGEPVSLVLVVKICLTKASAAESVSGDGAAAMAAGRSAREQTVVGPTVNGGLVMSTTQTMGVA